MLAGAGGWAARSSPGSKSSSELTDRYKRLLRRGQHLSEERADSPAGGRIREAKALIFLNDIAFIA